MCEYFFFFVFVDSWLSVREEEEHGLKKRIDQEIDKGRELRDTYIKLKVKR